MSSLREISLSNLYATKPNTRDVYTTWILSKCSKNEELEFRIIHAPQMEKGKFIELIETSDIILFEETLLLILNDLNLLDEPYRVCRRLFYLS